jgi:uncharacterized membrane protein YdbT with pleckstrin-like domain
VENWWRNVSSVEKQLKSKLLLIAAIIGSIICTILPTNIYTNKITAVCISHKAKGTEMVFSKFSVFVSFCYRVFGKIFIFVCNCCVLDASPQTSQSQNLDIYPKGRSLDRLML